MNEATRYGLPCREIDVEMIVFNEAEFIEKSVEALPRAGFDSFVVLDMHSTDGTPDILARMLDHRLVLHSFPRSSLLPLQNIAIALSNLDSRHVEPTSNHYLREASHAKADFQHPCSRRPIYAADEVCICHRPNAGFARCEMKGERLRG